MVPEIPLIFDDKDIFNVLATRHLTDRQIPVIDISEAGRLPRGIPSRRFRVSRGRKRAELQRCQIGGFFRQLQQFEGIARYMGEIVHSASRGAVGGVGGLPHQYSRGDLFKVERLKDSFFILPNDGYSDFFSKEEVGFMQRFVYNRSMKLPPTRT